MILKGVACFIGPVFSRHEQLGRVSAPIDWCIGQKALPHVCIYVVVATDCTDLVMAHGPRVVCRVPSAASSTASPEAQDPMRTPDYALQQSARRIDLLTLLTCISWVDQVPAHRLRQPLPLRPAVGGLRVCIARHSVGRHSRNQHGDKGSWDTVSQTGRSTHSEARKCAMPLATVRSSSAGHTSGRQPATNQPPDRSTNPAPPALSYSAAATRTTS